VAEVSESPRLNEIPLLKLWPEDGGHFMTLPLVLTESPVDGRPNLGMYRIQRHDDRRTGIHWQIHKGGGYHYSEAEALDQPLPVTILAGGPPALILGAIAPLPEGVPELLLASLLLGKRLPVLRTKSWPHPIPADAEFAFLGHVPPKTRRDEGPFGDHYGYYSLAHPYPAFHCRRVLRRRNAIWPATVVGKPRQEDLYIGDFLQDLLSPIFLRELARWTEAGASKYSERNWERGQPVMRYYDSAFRHLNNFLLGMEDENHLVAAAWNIQALFHTLHQLSRGELPPELDDRPEALVDPDGVE